MTQEEFKHLYDVLAENNPGEYEYDGDAVISTHICKGIWVDIVNEAMGGQGDLKEQLEKDLEFNENRYLEIRNSNKELSYQPAK